MSMRRMMPFTIVVLLLMQTLAMNMVVPAQAASGRGGTNDDFTVKSISIGNATVAADQWVQSDGTVVDYIFMDRTIEVTVAVQRFGAFWYRRHGSCFCGHRSPDWVHHGVV